jgi:ubiquinone biosynthesis protein UbiJ
MAIVATNYGPEYGTTNAPDYEVANQLAALDLEINSLEKATAGLRERLDQLCNQSVPAIKEGNGTPEAPLCEFADKLRRRVREIAALRYGIESLLARLQI